MEKRLAALLLHLFTNQVEHDINNLTHGDKLTDNMSVSTLQNLQSSTRSKPGPNVGHHR